MNQGSTKTRPSLWEEEVPPENRFRRVQQEVSLEGGFRPATAGRRGGPGMPLEMPDPDGDDPLRPSWQRYERPRNPWWRPASKAGRVFLAICSLIVLGGLTTAGLMLKTYLEHDARFRIAGTSNIQAAGLTEVNRPEMLSVFGEDIGRNVFFIPLKERRTQLEAIPWIERATVMRILPDQIRVAVVERKPVAFVREGQQIGLVDANGVLLSMPPATMAKRHYSFPVLTGIDARDTAASRKARIAVYQRLMSELDANNQHYSQEISEIDLTDPEDARVLIPEQGNDILAHFGQDHFLERYQRFQAHIAEWRRQYPRLAAVDLRYDRQVVLQMAPGKDAPQAPAGAAPATGARVAKPVARESTGKAQAKPDKAARAAGHRRTASKPRLLALAGSKAARARDRALKQRVARENRKRAEERAAAQNSSRLTSGPTTLQAAPAREQ